MLVSGIELMLNRLLPTPPYGGGDSSGNLVRVFVLPEPQDEPARLEEQLVGLAISLAIARDLCPPIVGVGLGFLVVLRAAMPVATINEDGDTRWMEHEIGGPAKPWERPGRDPVAQATAVNQRANEKFGPGISALVPGLGG